MAWFKRNKKQLKKAKLSTSNPYQDFTKGVRSADSSIAECNPSRLGRSKLRDMARALKLNPYIVRYTSLVSSILLGDAGFKLELRVKGTASDINYKISSELEDSFYQWAKDVSTCGRFSLTSLMGVCLKDHLVLGEMFLERVIVDGKLTYTPHTPESIDEDYNDSSRRIVEGIGYSIHNRPEVYYIKGTNHRRAVDADSMYHLFKANSAEDFRGTTALAPVISLLNKIDVFTNAVLDQQIISSSTATIYQRKSDMELLPTFETDEDGNAIVSEQAQFHKTLNSKEALVVPEGFELKTSEIGNVSPSNSTFVTDMLKRVSSGLLIPYRAISGDLSESSFSSLKFNSLMEQSHYKSMQDVYKELFVSIVTDFLNHNSLSSPLIDTQEYIDSISVQAYQMPALEPLKDAQVNGKNLDLSLTSKTKILARDGLTYEDILKDLEKERELDRIYNNEPKEVIDDTEQQTDYPKSN